jgi:hypothetical protein
MALRYVVVLGSSLMMTSLGMFVSGYSSEVYQKDSLDMKVKNKWSVIDFHGVRYWVGLNSVTEIEGIKYRDIFIFVESKSITIDAVKAFALNTATKYSHPLSLSITIYGNAEMLERAINNHLREYSVSFADTPEGVKSKKRWSEAHNPKSRGYFRAIYERSIDEEVIEYSPDPDKEEMEIVVIR